MSAGGKESARVRAEKAAAADPDTEIDRIKGLPKLAKPIIKNTRGQLAFEACVSSSTLQKVQKILQHGEADLIDRARRSYVSIHQAYTEVKKALKPSKAPKEPTEPTADDRYRKLNAAVQSIYTAPQRQEELKQHTERLLKAFVMPTFTFAEPEPEPVAVGAEP